jgi:hypothetical protein
MKMKPTVLMLIATGAGALLTSCVDTYPAGPTAVIEPAYRPGYVIQTLPPGYRAEVIGGTRYYYHNNVYYRPQGRSYVVVDSPHLHARHDSDSYRHRDRDRDWDRRGPRPDRNVTIIRELPNGYTVVNHRGQRYYRAGNRYYQSSAGGYIVVGSPF